jgi:hypothetical protein
LKKKLPILLKIAKSNIRSNHIIIERPTMKCHA